MTTITQKFATAIATGALLVNAYTPLAFAADTTITITGNGSNSDNTAAVTTSNTTTVEQNNTANVSNNVSGNASTGGNHANANTGGDTTINTGAAASSANVSTAVNLNHAEVDNCNCAGDTNVTIAGNGTKSDNTVGLSTFNTTYVGQNNDANVDNNVHTNASTGANKANANTGGDVTIVTGRAGAESNVSTQANANVASVGGGAGSNGGSLSAVISGNGAYSDSVIGLTSVNSVALLQDNEADIDNYVSANAKTGGNKANANTGGDVTIATGRADAIANVENKANFNAASLDCACDMDVLAKVAGNGTKSDNTIAASLFNDSFAGQANDAYLDNDVDANAKSGYNGSSANTGSDYSDPAIRTGNAFNEENVSNDANVNVLGSMPSLFPHNFHVNFNFDMMQLLGMIHMG